jgi:hypothetical protein
MRKGAREHGKNRPPPTSIQQQAVSPLAFPRDARYTHAMHAPTPLAAPTLRRRLGLWSAISVVIGSTIGSGIFRSPAGIADKLPGPLPKIGRAHV